MNPQQFEEIFEQVKSEPKLAETMRRFVLNCAVKIGTY